MGPESICGTHGQMVAGRGATESYMEWVGSDEFGRRCPFWRGRAQFPTVLRSPGGLPGAGFTQTKCHGAFSDVASGIPSLAHYVCCSRVRGHCRRSTFCESSPMPFRVWLGLAQDVEAEATASVEGARRVVIATVAHRRARALWTTGGGRRNSGAADAWVRVAPWGMGFPKLATVVRAALKASATLPHSPVRGGSGAGVG